MKTRLFALDYGRGTMAGFFADSGAKNISPKELMDRDGEPSGFAVMDDGSTRVGRRMDTIGGHEYPHVTHFHINVKEMPTGNDTLQIEYAKAWRAQIVQNNPALFSEPGIEEQWFIGCPTGWRDAKTIANYKRIFETAGFPNVVIVRESNAAMMWAEDSYAFMKDMDPEAGVLCLDLGAYSADATWVRHGKKKSPKAKSETVSSYGGYVGASLIERMIVLANFENAYRNKKNAYNSDETIAAIKAEYEKPDGKFRTYLLNTARHLKETYFSAIAAGATKYAHQDAVADVDLFFDENSEDQFGDTSFGLYLNDRMAQAILDDRSVKNVLGAEFDTLPEEVRRELGEKSWHEALRDFFRNTLKICPAFAERAQGPSSDRKAVVILTGGASLMPFVKDVLLEVMPNTQVYSDNNPMSTIAQGLLMFGPDKLKSIAFDDKLGRLLVSDKAFEDGKKSSWREVLDFVEDLQERIKSDQRSDSAEIARINAQIDVIKDSKLNEIISQASEKFGGSIISSAIVKRINCLVDAVNGWRDRDFDSDQIVPHARAAFKAWFEGGMLTEFAESTKETKKFIIDELNKLFEPLLKQYDELNDEKMFAGGNLELPSIDEFLTEWKTFFDTFDESIKKQDHLYSQLENPGFWGETFGTSRQDILNVLADKLNERNEGWQKEAYDALHNTWFTSNAVYLPFLINCLYEIKKGLTEAEKLKLGELIVEDAL